MTSVVAFSKVSNEPPPFQKRASKNLLFSKYAPFPGSSFFAAGEKVPFSAWSVSSWAGRPIFFPRTFPFVCLAMHANLPCAPRLLDFARSDYSWFNSRRSVVFLRITRPRARPFCQLRFSPADENLLNWRWLLRFRGFRPFKCYSLSVPEVLMRRWCFVGEKSTVLGRDGRKRAPTSSSKTTSSWSSQLTSYSGLFVMLFLFFFFELCPSCLFWITSAQLTSQRNFQWNFQ